MKILSKKKQDDIGLRLAVILTALIRDNQVGLDALRCITDQCCEISFAVGGIDLTEKIRRSV